MPILTATTAASTTTVTAVTTTTPAPTTSTAFAIDYITVRSIVRTRDRTRLHQMQMGVDLHLLPSAAGASSPAGGASPPSLGLPPRR